MSDAPSPRKQYDAFKEGVVPPKTQWKKLGSRFVRVPEDKIKGVRWNKSSNSWVAHIGGFGHQLQQKHFRTKEEAVKQRRAWLDEIEGSA